MPSISCFIINTQKIIAVLNVPLPFTNTKVNTEQGNDIPGI